MSRLNAISLAICFLQAPVASAKILYVSSHGPLTSLSDARDAIRAMRRGGNLAPVTVQVRAGTYFLKEPLVLTQEDSGTADHPVVYEAYSGEHPVLSGGRILTGWTKGAGGLWTAKGAEGWNFRQLFVGGRRARRARTPNEGFFRLDGPSSVDKPFRLKYRGGEIRPAWAERGDVEVIALLAWSEIRMPIVSVDPEARVATLAGNPHPWNREADARYYIENAPDALDAEGEWYLDRKAGLVFYKPLAGENVSAEEVVAPVLSQLIRLEGKPEEGRFVHHVVFRGLHFAHTDWNMCREGHADTQAANTVNAAFEAVGARDCAVEKCRFSRLGNYAIWLGRGSKRDRIVANEIFDIGAGGVKIGETSMRQNEAEQNSDHEITDNHIHDLGLVYPSAIGVWIGQSGRNTVAHNHIHDLFYSAVSVCWTWGYGPNQCKGNLIEYNHLHHVGKDMLSDLGAIYTLGVQPGTRIRNNLIHDVQAFTYGGWGLYPDEGSSEILFENNIVYRTKSAGFHQHYGRENIIRNNIFAFNEESQLRRTRAEPHLSFTFENNIVYFDRGKLLETNWTGEKFKMNKNVYCDARGVAIRFSGNSWDEWHARGLDTESVIADPQFVNVANFDFRLRPGSPALSLGFKPIDMTDVGPRSH